MSSFMVILKKIKVDENVITYSYSPEGGLKTGILSYYPKEDKCVVEKESGYKYEALGMHRGHAFNKIKLMYKENKFPEEVLVAWG